MLQDADRRLEGRSLTFQVGSDRIRIDGRDEIAHRGRPRAERTQEALSERRLLRVSGLHQVLRTKGRRARGRARDPPGRGRRAARAERRGQDDDLLHGRGPRPAGQRAGVPGRGGHHRAADVPAGAGRHRLPAAGGERLPQADGRGERARDPRDARPARLRAARAGAPAARGAGHRRHGAPAAPTPSRAASGGASRSAARWRPRPRSSCSTSRSRASTRWRCSTSRRSSRTCGTAASAS